MTTLEASVLVVLNMDVLAYLNALSVSVDPPEEYRTRSISDIMTDRLEKLRNPNIFVTELLKVKALNLRDRELRPRINSFTNIFMVLKLYGPTVPVSSIIIKISAAPQSLTAPPVWVSLQTTPASSMCLQLFRRKPLCEQL